MTASLVFRYLGGCPGRARPEQVAVTIHAAHFELRARRWGWSIAFDAVARVEDLQPTADGGHMLGVVWTPPGEAARTLLLSGPEAGRLRFLLAQGVATARLAATQPAPVALSPGPRPRRPPRAAGPWARELRRMRAVGLAAMVVALAALVLVVAVSMVVLDGEGGSGHWRQEQETLRRLSSDARLAAERNDAAALSLALQALVDRCYALEHRNGEAANSGDRFTEVHQICAGAGVPLY